MTTQPSTPLRVILADDHPVVLLGLRVLLQKDHNITIVGEAASVDELWDLLDSTSCDLLITDYVMPEGKRGNGLVMLEQLRYTYPELRIIIVTMISNAGLLKTMLDIGANGVLEKSFSAKELGGLRPVSQTPSLGGMMKSEVVYGNTKDLQSRVQA